MNAILMEISKSLTKNWLRKSLLFSGCMVLFASCTKDFASRDWNPYFKARINGHDVSVIACGTSSFVAEYIRDTTIFTAFGCGGETAGFYIHGMVSDGTYTLNNSNQAFYGIYPLNYVTTRVKTGTIVIRSGIFTLPNGGRIPMVEGEFSFDAIDSVSGQEIKVTSGKYLLGKYHY